jgi:hypothetical protein
MQDFSAAPTNSDKPDAALVQFREFRIGCDFGIKVEPLRISAGNLVPKLHKAHRFSSLIVSRQIAVGIAQHATLLLLGEETQDAG